MLFYIFNSVPAVNYIDIINCVATCATALFTLGAVIGAGIFAYRQNKITERGPEVDLALRYFTHYQKLSELLYIWGAYFDPTSVEINGETMQAFSFSSDQRNKQYILEFNPTNLEKLQLLKNEAELCFSQDIIKLNQDIFEKANAIFIKKVFVLNYNSQTQTQYFYNGNTGVLENTFMKHSNNKIPLEMELSLAYSNFKEEYLSHNGMLEVKAKYSVHTRKISDIN